jgi:hypothetical protein
MLRSRRPVKAPPRLIGLPARRRHRRRPASAGCRASDFVLMARGGKSWQRSNLGSFLGVKRRVERVDVIPAFDPVVRRAGSLQCSNRLWRGDCLQLKPRISLLTPSAAVTVARGEQNLAPGNRDGQRRQVHRRRIRRRERKIGADPKRRRSICLSKRHDVRLVRSGRHREVFVRGREQRQFRAQSSPGQ